VSRLPVFPIKYISNSIGTSQITFHEFINGGVAMFFQPIGDEVVFFGDANILSMHFSFFFHYLIA